ncbi:MAG: YfiR family protein [Pseudomonadales bacterium]|nr:YfiR family protein [Pseudomonadales bacterium]
MTIRLRCLGLFLAWIIGLLPLGAWAVSDGDKVKALFLFNFANFVEWPAKAFESGSTPLKMCLYGRVEFAPFLLAMDQTLIGDRRLQVRHTKDLDTIKSGCHILFVDDDRYLDLPRFLSDLNYQYVLSMGEKDDFVERGGIVHIVRTSDHVEFDINISQAMQNGLFISSDLLSLARKVRKYTAKRSPTPAVKPADDHD